MEESFDSEIGENQEGEVQMSSALLMINKMIWGFDFS
jgi:hypothetical protein